MICPNCRKENPPDARFCIFCGSPLPMAKNDNSQQQAESIKNEIQQLRGLVRLITQRLDALEQGQVTMPSLIKKVEIPEPVLPAAPVLPTEEVQLEEEISVAEEEKPQVEGPLAEKEKRISEEVPAAAGKEKELPFEKWIIEEAEPEFKEPPAPVKEKSKAAKPREWEQILGGNWLARIGVLALIIGAGFFLKYAFDNNWIGPTARVIIGVIVGLAMLGLGYWWRQRYPIMTRVLSGGGIGILYLSIFASSATYHLIPLAAAVILLLVTSIISATLARRYDSVVLAIFGIIGAFFAPFILGAFDRNAVKEGESGQGIQLLVYIIVVDIGVLILATMRNWRWFNLLSLGCTLITYGFWYGEFHHRVNTGTAEIGITAVFLIFTGATSLFHIIWRRIPKLFDYILMVLTAGAYFLISLGLMQDEYRGWLGGFTLLLAIFYGLLSYFNYRRNSANPLLSLFALGTGIVFLTTAIPIQFSNNAWATIFWAAEAAVLIWLTFQARIPIFLYFGGLAFILVAVRLLGFDTWINHNHLDPVLNERFLAFIVSIAFMWLAAYLFWKNRKSDEKIDYMMIIGAADFFTLWIIGFEVFDYQNQVMTTPHSLSLLILLALAGATINNLVFWRRKPDIVDTVLNTVNPIAFIIFSTFIWDELRVWMGTGYLLIALFYGIHTYQLYKRKDEGNRIWWYPLVISLGFLTAFFQIQLSNAAWTTIIWAAEAVALIWLTFKTRIPILKYLGYIAFLLVAVRLLGFDTWRNRNILEPVFNERLLAFIISIAFMWLAAFLLWKNRQGNKDKHYIVMIAAVDFFTLWIIGFEIFDYQAHWVMTTSKSLSLLILLALAGATINNLVFWRRKPDTMDAVLTTVNATAFVIFSVFIWHELRSWIGTGYLLLALFYGILTYRVFQTETANNKLRPYSLGIGLGLLTAAIQIQLGDKAWTTIVWAAEFALLVQLSFILRRPSLRNYSYAIFLAMALRLLAFDTTVDIKTLTPFLNERFLAFVIGIASTYLAIYILRKNKESFPEWRVPASTLAAFANIFSLWILIFEVWQAFSNPISTADPAARVGLSNAQNLSLTGVLALYAVAGLITGIWKHWRAVRVSSLVLLAVPILKVFTYDVFKLETSYRIGAFVGLGLLLLISAYLYQRYSNVIKGVFREK